MAKFVRCEDPADPLRCQSGGKSGQCPYLSLKGMAERGHLLDDELDLSLYSDIDKCSRHGGHAQLTAANTKKVHSYRLQVWQKRVDEFAEGENVKSLRGEIGITRMLIEEIINRCEDNQQLLLYSQKISQLIAQAEKLVRSCERIERTSSMMLDRSSALSFASTVVDVIGKHIDDPEIIDAISGEIIDALADE